MDNEINNIESVKGVAVYCSSSTHIDQRYIQAAYDLGAALARAGIPVINGGGKMSMMAAVSDGALDNGGKAIGVIPRFMHEADRHHKGLSELIITHDMHERKATMADLSRAVVAMPGGVGTLDELAEMMTWHKLGLYRGKVIIYNVNGYFDSLIFWLQESIDQQFTCEKKLPWIVTNSLEETINSV